MSFRSWLRNLRSALEASRDKPTYWRKRPTHATAPRPRLEPLEDRSVPAFLAPVIYAAETSSRDVVTADFNNDSVLDIAVVNTYSDTVSVLLGHADGTFQAAIPSPAGNGPASLAVGDFNGDGKLDLAAATYSADSVSADVTVLLGNGNGSFQVPAVIDLGSEPSGRVSVSVGDFNADGKLDICALNNFWVDEYGYPYGYLQYYGMAAVLLGTGTGTFGSPKWSAIGESGGHIHAAIVEDFNGDGKLDIAATSDYGEAYVELGTGTGSFQNNNSYDFLAYSIVASDLNNDGKVDLAAASESYVSVLLGNGNGSFGTARTYSVGDEWIYDLAVADFNGDGKHDMIAPNSLSGAVSVLLGTGAGAFAPPVTADVGTWPAGVAAGDFNCDGWLDVAAANGGDNTVSVLINDHSWDTTPPPPTVSINDATVTEGNTGTVNATFTVTLSAPYGQSVTVNYSTANGTATAGSDFQNASGTLTFAPGETSKFVTVPVVGDRIGEANETFFVNLTSPNNATIADGQGAGTIVDDEPRVSISDVTMKEGNSGLTAFAFTVSLSAAYDVPVTVDYATANGTATAGNDYQAVSGTLTISAGQTMGTITVWVNSDRLAEPNKTFLVNLSNLNYGAVADDLGVGTIVDDEPRISISDVTRREGRKNTTSFVFTVTLSAAYDQPVTMSYRTVDGTATTSDGDYVAKSGTITFAPGETTKTVTIEVKGDSKREANETFDLDLSGNSTNSWFSKSRGTGTILNDD